MGERGFRGASWDEPGGFFHVKHDLGSTLFIIPTRNQQNLFSQRIFTDKSGEHFWNFGPFPVVQIVFVQYKRVGGQSIPGLMPFQEHDLYFQTLIRFSKPGDATPLLQARTSPVGQCDCSVCWLSFPRNPFRQGFEPAIAGVILIVL